MKTFEVILIGMDGELAREQVAGDPVTDCINLRDDAGRVWMLRPGDKLVIRDEED